MTRGGGAALALAGAIASILLLLSRTTTLWDRDEPRFAQAAVEMLASDNYLVPTFNGELRAQKPPLVYWLMTVSLRAFGRGELASRFWSPVALAVAALATFSIGRRLWSPRAGLLAMVMLVLNPLAVVEGLAATADAVLLAGITVSLAIVAAMLDRPATWRDGASLAAALAVALLAKGPVGLLLPVTIAGAACWSARGALAAPGRFTAALIGAGAASVIVFAAWFIPANAATSGRMAAEGLVRENWIRALVPMEHHGVSIALAPLYYLLVVVAGFAPWVMFLPAAIVRLGASTVRRTPAGALLLSWMAVPMAAFTLAATKLPHYILPMWPALALAAAWSVVEVPANPLPRARAVGGALAAATGAAATIALVSAARAEMVPGVSAAAYVTAALMIAVSIPTLALFGLRRDRAVVRWSIASSAIVVAWIALGVAPILDAAKPAPRLAARVNAVAPAGRPVFVYGFAEPSIIFYMERPIVILDGAPAVAAWARERGPDVLVAPREAIVDVERAAGPLGLRELESSRGWNVANGRIVDLVAFVRAAGR